MPLTNVQHSALLEAELPAESQPASHLSSLPNLISDHLFKTIPVLSGNIYSPPPARKFTAEELATKKDHITRQTRACAIVKHPLGSIVEYPETGVEINDSIAHVFTVDPTNFIHPKLDFQYSLGDSQGSRRNVACKFDSLIDNTGSDLPVMCKVESIGCE